MSLKRRKIFTPKGGFWIRVDAFIIDALILVIIIGIIATVAFLLLDHLHFLKPTTDSPINLLKSFKPLLIALAILSVGINYLYYTFFYGTIGQTPGKIICHLKVISLNGKHLSYPQASLRWLGYFLSTLPCFLGFLWVVFDHRNQGFHDKLARTAVIHLLGKD